MATYEQDIVMFETKENGDKVIKMPISRANNIEGIGRSISTAYAVGDVVYVDNNKKVALKCITAGTTSNSELNVSGLSVGDTVTDGGVVWQVCNRTSDVTSVNGKTGDVVVDVGVTSVNNKSGAVTLKESPSDMTDYIVESYRNGTEWYEVYKSGKVRQGGAVANGNGGEVTVTFLKKFANVDYFINKHIGANDAGYPTGQYASFYNLTQTNAKTKQGSTYPYTRWIAEGQGA